MFFIKPLSTYLAVYLITCLKDFQCLAHGSKCKITPASPDWPKQHEWKALNQSVSGRLISPKPPALVCHPGEDFNQQACTVLSEQWSTSSYHAQQPVSVDYNDDTCKPDGNTTCSPAGYPAFVINATEAKHIQAGVNFARRTGVRLIVKGTGHDIPGRSSGRGSLSIWTHYMQGIDIRMPDGHKEGKARIMAGMRGGEILKAAAKKNVTIVTGADPGVGIGGWISGGGHGPLSSRYGLGADQVLSMEVVAADGRFLKIDPKHHPDLFWAMRGGGGLTFGVLVAVTVRVYPAVSFTEYLFSYNTTANSDTFWDLAALFHSHIPRISDGGGMGYYYQFANQTVEPDPKQQGKIQGVLLFPAKSTAEAKAIMDPLESAIRDGKWTDKVFPIGLPVNFPSFSAQWANNPPGSVGTDTRLGSRLLDSKALTSNTTALKLALKTSSPLPWVLLGHIVAGPGPRDVEIPGGGNAVLPAWRKAYTHVVLPRTWTSGNETQEAEVQDDLRNVRTQALKDLAPDMGSYMSESDPTEPEPAQTFWGKNYGRLKKLKMQWDPKGVFWCKFCVGSEDWEVLDGDAIGQHEGKICRKGT